MANLKASIKDIRQTKKRRVRNQDAKSAMGTAIKKALKAILEKTDSAAELVRKAVKAIDKNISNGIIHQNTGSRKKSRLTKKLNKLSK